MRKFLRKHILIIIAVLYLLSPIDLIPEVIPVVGWADDLLVALIVLLMKYFEYKKEKQKVELAKSEKSKIIEGEIVDG